jgi:hypothetical protein
MKIHPVGQADMTKLMAAFFAILRKGLKAGRDMNTTLKEHAHVTAVY